MKKFLRFAKNSNHVMVIATVALFAAGLFILWIASLRIPALESIEERRIDSSTKIYDRTGEILLYDMSQDVRREQITLDKISPYVKSATIAIEDKDFYKHHGFVLSSFLRAVWANVTSLSFSQGGSTITQQVVKNSILTKDKTPTRKLKELILALKLEKVLTKEEILSLYLNEIPYGGTIYGVEEASHAFFGKSASDLTLAESAYLASLPKAPSYYSPYGSHLDALETRKNIVLSEMLKQGLISEEELQTAVNEKVVFKERQDNGLIKAPHFVFFVIDFLAKKYGEDALQHNGYKIVTTLDYDIQQDAEAIAKKYGPINQEKFNGENNATVVIDPKTGEILAMTGSRDYFDKSIDGNFNAALGLRQPGSTFKPFVYSVLFNKGFTSETVLFDAQIQFSTACPPDNFTTDDPCYAPGNYDEKFRGPMTIRNALAQSINIPAVEASYLAGVPNSIKLAQSMGIGSLTDPSKYGLSLVLGGGAVSLLDLTSAYSVFANDGIRNPYTPVLWVEDGQGNVIDKSIPFPKRVLPEETARTISNILSDNVARTPGYGPNSPLYVAERDVAVKTGTSNDYRDAWIVGYAPNITVGAWVGNNDNSPMAKKVAGLIVSPMWRELMDKILPKLPVEAFVPPEPLDPDLKPVLRGEVGPGPHSILHWVDKDNPRGPVPSNPGNDPQYSYWEYGIARWVSLNGGSFNQPTTDNIQPTTGPQPAGAGFVPLPTPLGF
ncbi:transglycosylase domain-containing protein [Candidatus Parcubacteria bacterium]|nr:transglycosylase domain-containing protein [Candidatus Parcubacteria bacterium]